jgi:transketolase
MEIKRSGKQHGEYMIVELNQRSKQVRRDIITLSLANGAYHLGGSFSCVEILLALYDTLLKSEDRCILSKGHACFSLYVLLREKGLNPELWGHPNLDLANGIHWSSGSMGHGFPAGVGMAFARKKLNKPGHIYILIGDGECQEGTTWESVLIAGKHKLNNLTVIVDNNKIQGSDTVDNVLPVIPALRLAAVASKWTMDEVDGHNIFGILKALSYRTDCPSLIVANTIKGAGVSYMENTALWHANYPNKEQVQQAMEELQ